MKELKLLTEWADSVIDNRVSKVSEATLAKQHAPTRMGTQMTGKADRPLPRQVDIAYKAQRAHPELSPDQALALYMSDELVDKEKMDFAQNKLINRVKGENDKLTRTVSELSKELHDFEQHSQQTDQEVARLKDLSARLKPASEITKQSAMATSQQIEKMLKDVEELRAKPGMDPKKQQELEQKINDIKSGGLSSDEVNNIHKTIEVLAHKQAIDDALFNNVMNRLDDTQSKLDSKEKRFQKSIRKNAEKIGQWGNKFAELDKKFNDIEAKANEKLAQIDRASEEADETLDRIAQMVRQSNPNVVKPTAQALTNLDDKEEVQQAMGKPSATTLPAHAYSQQEISDYDTAVDTEEPYDDESYASMSDLLNKYRKPTNVKNNGQLGEQIEMHEPEDEVETVIIPKLVRRYRNTYPLDLQKWSEEQLKTILRKTVDRGLLIWAPDIDEARVNRYLEACHNWIRKLRPVAPELPGMPETPPQQPTRPIAESILSDFTKVLDKLTGGY